jgi:hypothetical protein
VPQRIENGTRSQVMRSLVSFPEDATVGATIALSRLKFAVSIAPQVLNRGGGLAGDRIPSDRPKLIPDTPIPARQGSTMPTRTTSEQIVHGRLHPYAPAAATPPEGHVPLGRTSRTTSTCGCLSFLIPP